jgi:hypothetical protein
MDTKDELIGQAQEDGKLEREDGEGRKVIPSETKRSEAPAIPYGNPPEAGDQEPPESPSVSSFA